MTNPLEPWFLGHTTDTITGRPTIYTVEQEFAKMEFAGKQMTHQQSLDTVIEFQLPIGWTCSHSDTLKQIELINLNPACGCSESRYTIDTVKHTLTVEYRTNVCNDHCDRCTHIKYYNVDTLDEILSCIM